MLDDRERDLLFEIERQLLMEDPGIVRSFGTIQRHRPAEPGRGTERIMAAAGLVLCVVLLIGPRVLAPADVVARRMAGPPRIAGHDHA